ERDDDRSRHEHGEQEHERQSEAPADQRLASSAAARGHKPVPIDSARCCIAAHPSSGDVLPCVTCSSWSSIAEATSSHVGIAGGALASSSCSPNVASSGSSASAGSSHATCTAGRSFTVSYHLTCTSGRDRYSTNAHA